MAGADEMRNTPSRMRMSERFYCLPRTSSPRP